jgi:hypothetical protein
LDEELLAAISAWRGRMALYPNEINLNNARFTYTFIFGKSGEISGSEVEC